MSRNKVSSKIPESIGICKHCQVTQEFHELDINKEQYYCPHNQTLAIKRAHDHAWDLHWPFTKEDIKRINLFAESEYLKQQKKLSSSQKLN